MARRRTKRNKWTARSKVLRRLTDHCVVCFSEERLHAHHLRYRQGGRGSDLERPEDIVILCYRCHMELHKRKMLGGAKFLTFRDEFRREATGHDLDTAIADWVGR